MTVLIAIRGDKSEHTLNRIKLTNDMKDEVLEEFSRQEESFRLNREEIPFDQNWHTEEDEIAVIPIPETEELFDEIIECDESALTVLNIQQLDGIRGVAVKLNRNKSDVILIQTFYPAQLFKRPRFISLTIYEKNTYARLDDPGFHLDRKLLCIVEEGAIKFQSITRLGRLIDTTEIFDEASNPMIRSFTNTYRNIIQVDDMNVLFDQTKRNERRFISSILRRNALKHATVDQIEELARDTRLKLEITEDNKIRVPDTSPEITEFMRMLNEGRYKGPFSGDAFITNSKRRV